MQCFEGSRLGSQSRDRGSEKTDYHESIVIQSGHQIPFKPSGKRCVLQIKAQKQPRSPETAVHPCIHMHLKRRRGGLSAQCRTY